jgi:geranylgeranyl pyrophosphate synthase
MEIIKPNQALQKSEKEALLRQQARELRREKAMSSFRRSNAYKYVKQILEEEIDRAADSRNIPSDAQNLEETAKLLIISQRTIVVLENIKSRLL